MRCEDCIHYEVCADTQADQFLIANDQNYSTGEVDCDYFKDKSKMIELPLSPNEHARYMANLNCDKCPLCNSKHLVIPMYKEFTRGIFKRKHYKIDCYTCAECGKHWESEPYIFEKEVW